MSAAAYIAEVMSCLDTRWVHQGRMKGAGLDCLGLIGMSALALDLPGAAQWRATPEYHNYGRNPDPELMFAGCDALMDRVAIADAAAADVLVFRCGRHPMHFGLLSAADRMIHAWLGAGRVIEQRLDAKWAARIVRAYRLRGIE